jgi:hypothetical protein
MKKLSFNLRDSDSIFIARLLVFFTALFGMDLFKNRIAGLVSQDVLQQAYNHYVDTYEKGKYGDRNFINGRKEARRVVEDHCRMVLRILEMVADEADLLVLQNAGVEICRTAKRKKQVAPAQQ